MGLTRYISLACQTFLPSPKKRCGHAMPDYRSFGHGASGISLINVATASASKQAGVRYVATGLGISIVTTTSERINQWSLGAQAYAWEHMPIRVGVPLASCTYNWVCVYIMGPTIWCAVYIWRLLTCLSIAACTCMHKTAIYLYRYTTKLEVSIIISHESPSTI